MKYTFLNTSPLTGILRKMNIEMQPSQLAELTDPRRLRNIQDILPDNTPEEREFLLSGIHPDDWPFEEEVQHQQVQVLPPPASEEERRARVMDELWADLDRIHSMFTVGAVVNYKKKLKKGVH
jgi:hypothetical protein